MNIINALSFLECNLGESGATEALLLVLYYVRLVIRILQIAVPIALILWGSIDMGKAVIAGEEKKMKEARKPFIQRIISAVIVFCIPFIVNFVVSLVTTNTEYKDCWNQATEKPENTGFGDSVNDGL